MWHKVKINSENNIKLKWKVIFLIKNRVKIEKIKLKLVGNRRKTNLITFFSNNNLYIVNIVLVAKVINFLLVELL